jgi:signal transduction histidine kinase
VSSVVRLARSSWAVAWVVSVVTAIGFARLFFSGDSWAWFGFAAAQAIASALLIAWARRASFRVGEMQSEAEAPLWKTAGEAIHDVGTPLHVMRFCVQQLFDNPSVVNTERFRDQLTRSSDRTLEAFESLRGFVRSVRDEEGPASLRSVLSHALRVVRARFPEHPALRSLDASSSPDEMLQIGSGPLLRSVSFLLGSCVKSKGPVSLLTERGKNDLRIAITGEASGCCATDVDVQSVRHWIEQWGGDLRRTSLQGGGRVGYALRLEREGRG